MTAIKLLTTVDAARILSVNPDTLRRWRYEGIGPDYVKLGNGPKAQVRYDEAVLEAYIRENTRVPSVRDRANE